MNRLAVTAALVASLAACATEEETYDPYELEGDVFGQDLEGKGDTPIAGINENTFKAFGVLNAAATLDAAGWKSVTGVSTSKANKLVAAQRSSGWGLTGVPSIRALTRLGLSSTAIGKLADYAQANGLVPKAAVKIPVQSEDGVFLYTVNGQMASEHLPYFSKSMYVWAGVAGAAQFTYFTGLQDRAYEAGLELGVEMYTGPAFDAGDGNTPVCYVGSKLAAPNAALTGAGYVWSEQLYTFGWRAGTTTWLDHIEEAELLELFSYEDDRTAWETFDTAGSEIIFASTYSDDGDDPSVYALDRCR